MNTRLLTVVAGLSLLAVACTDARTGLERTGGPSLKAISEARFGGNPDFFFGSPLATTPGAGTVHFDVGGHNKHITPYVRVCETDGAEGVAGCLADVTATVLGSPAGQAMELVANQESYIGMVVTRAFDTGRNYRLEIWGIALSGASDRGTVDQRWLFGWRDITHSSVAASCTGAEPFCPQPYGVTLPVKVRVEKFAFCPVTRSCATQFIASGRDALFDVPLPEGSGAPNAQLFVPAQAGLGFALSFEPCTTDENTAVANSLDIPTFGPCLKTNTTFNGQLQLPAIISLCDELDSDSFGISHQQEHQLSLHHLTNDLSVATALPEAWSCATTTAMREETGLLRLASVVKKTLSGLVSVRTLHAAPVPIDRGGGGMTLSLNSFFKLALPAKFEYVSASDASQSGFAGGTRTLSAKVTDLFGEPVRNARVRWTVATSPAPGASVTTATPVLTDAAGIATATVQTSTAPGENVFYASGRGIAANGATECTAPSPDTSSCNGPRGAFDPFIPMHTPEFDPSGVELPIDIAEGTRLPFTITTCALGSGTATIDGTFSAEWACARTYNFTANVSGGSKPATLYVMNDASRLYLAVRLQRNADDRVNRLQFNFDNDSDGTTEVGDDVLSLDAVTGLLDAYMTAKCTNSSQSSCFATDVSGGGTNDGSGAVANAGGVTTYELSHPLNTADDARDFSRSAGQALGLFLTLQTGNGAAGNTQWPGFRQYVQITVVP